MKKILLVLAASAGIGVRRALQEEAQRSEEFVLKLEVAEQERRYWAITPRPGPPPISLSSPRKSKGEKKRTASALRGRGWR